MGGMAEIFRDMRESSQERRKKNRENAVHILKENKITYTSKNCGAHLILKGPDSLIDYWPGTGRWKSRNGKKGFGIRNLLEYLK